MSARDVYKELKLRGYHYTGNYRSIKKVSTDGTSGHISWLNDWVAFMDNMLQMKILCVDSRGLYVPTGIKKMVIDTKAHLSQISMGEEGKGMLRIFVKIIRQDMPRNLFLIFRISGIRQ